MSTLSPPCPRTIFDRLRKLEIGTLKAGQVRELAEAAEKQYERRYLAGLNTVTGLVVGLTFIGALFFYVLPVEISLFWMLAIGVSWGVSGLTAIFGWYGFATDKHRADWQTVTYEYHVGAWYRRPLPRSVAELAGILQHEFGNDAVFVERVVGDPFLLVDTGDELVYVAYWQGRDKLVLGDL